jgi:hypothetical protein
MIYSSVYRVAMSPDKKLDWFRRHGYTPEEINDVRALAKARYTSDYAARPIVTAPLDASSSSLYSGSGLPNEWVSVTQSD